MKKIFLMIALIIVLSTPVASFAEQTENYIPRAEFVRDALNRAGTRIQEAAVSSFNDVTDEAMIPYIETAYKNGIISGYEGNFEPYRNITKEEAIKIIAGLFGERVGVRERIDRFSDADFGYTTDETASPWAKPYIAYALDAGLIKNGDETFHPYAFVTTDKASDMIETAGGTYEMLFTRGGLSASDMLVSMNKTLSEIDTYKQKGVILIKTEFIIEGLTPEQIKEEDGLISSLGDNMAIVMKTDTESAVQNPDKIYMKQFITPETETPGIEQYSETFIDGSLMYTRMSDSGKWSVSNIAPIMEQLKPLSDQEPQQIAPLSEDELRLYKEFARYEEDVTTDDGTYYVISFDIDKDTYSEYFSEIMEKAMDSIATLQVEDPTLSGTPGFDPQQYKQTMMDIVSNMEIEQSYKYYIDSITLLPDRVWMSQKSAVPMDQNMLEALSAAGEEIPLFSFKILSHVEGNTKIYDLGENVEFPVITEDDIMDKKEFVPAETETPLE